MYKIIENIKTLGLGSLADNCPPISKIVRKKNRKKYFCPPNSKIARHPKPPLISIESHKNKINGGKFLD
jgi:hypothetical protein